MGAVSGNHSLGALGPEKKESSRRKTMSESTMGWVARDYDYLACSGADAVDLWGGFRQGICDLCARI